MTTDQDANELSQVLHILKCSEYGSEDFNLSYKTLMILENKMIDSIWERIKNKYFNKQECAYLDIIGRLINIDDDDYDFEIGPDVISKIIKADWEFLEYCKLQVGQKNNYPYPIKFQIKHNLSLLSRAIELC